MMFRCMVTFAGFGVSRILYKISGEALMGTKNFGHDVDVMRKIAQDVAYVRNLGIEVCLVVGGGNIYRGSSAEEAGMERSVADYIGMLATIMNAIALQHVLEECGVQTRVQSAIPVTSICEPYARRKAIRHLEKGRVVLFAAGTGNPFFTTDTTAVLRAMEMNCTMIFKGTSVDGVYSSDPKKNPSATRYSSITHNDVITQNLRVMDISAISLARDKCLPIAIFSIKKENPLSSLLGGHEDLYTIISSSAAAKS